MAELWPAVRQDQLPLLEAVICEPVCATESTASESEPAKKPAAQPVQVYRRLPAEWKLPTPPDAITRPGHEATDPRDEIEFSWAGEHARLTGNLVHRLLQLIAEQGESSWVSSGGMASRENWCRQQLASDGVTGEKAEQILRRTGKAVENCLASERGAWILKPRDESACEYAMTALLDGQAHNMKLDHTFVEADERWIVDYKTSSHSGGDLDGFLKNEKERYTGQLERYRQAMAMTETRPIRIALYFPLLDTFLEL